MGKENLQQMVEVVRAFCLHQNFDSKGFSALAPGPGPYMCIKSLKMCIKSESKEITLRKRLRICSVISVNYHYINVYAQLTD